MASLPARAARGVLGQWRVGRYGRVAVLGKTAESRLGGIVALPVARQPVRRRALRVHRGERVGARRQVRLEVVVLMLVVLTLVVLTLVVLTLVVLTLVMPA